MKPLMMELADYLTELTRWHTHSEAFTVKIGNTSVTTRHRLKVPPLLLQLDAATASGDGASRGGGGFESRPAAPLEALDALAWIDDAAARWVRRLGEDDPGDTMVCMRRLAGIVATTTFCGRLSSRRDKDTGGWCCTRHELEADVRRWWTHARIVTGWDSAAWRPDNTCPECGRRGGLRVRLEQRSGVCVECKAAWGPFDHQNGYQQLAAHIRAESAEERAAVAPEPCRCAWPRRRFGLEGLCPRCGSATCENAVRSLGSRRQAG